jgi:hypothetical protein
MKAKHDEPVEVKPKPVRVARYSKRLGLRQHVARLKRKLRRWQRVGSKLCRTARQVLKDGRLETVIVERKRVFKTAGIERELANASARL